MRQCDRPGEKKGTGKKKGKRGCPPFLFICRSLMPFDILDDGLWVFGRVRHCILYNAIGKSAENSTGPGLEGEPERYEGIDPPGIFL